MYSKGRLMTYGTVLKKHKPHFWSKPERVAERVPICPHCKSKRLKILNESHSPHDSLGDTIYYKCLRCRFRFFAVETEHEEGYFQNTGQLLLERPKLSEEESYEDVKTDNSH